MSDITALLTAYDHGYQVRFNGDRPRIVPGKDAKLAKDLLAIKPLETLIGYFPRFFASTDKLIVEAGYTFAIFAFRINALATAKAQQPAAEPASDAHRSHVEAIKADQAAYVPPVQKPRYKPEYITDSQRQELLRLMRATMAKIEAKGMR